MIPPALDPWLPLAVALAALLISQRLVTQALLRLFYRLTGNEAMTMWLFALLLWPGIVLHEVAHWVVAVLLRVPARLPYLLPTGRDARGQMVLGHVRIARTDPLRRSLIGVAPLVAGSAAVILLARHAFALPLPALTLGLDSLVPLLMALPTVFDAPDVWLWLYLVFATANAMLPSASDREGWPTVLGFALAVGLAIVFTVGVPQVPAGVTLWGLRGVAWLTLAFVLTATLNAGLWLALVVIAGAMRVLGR